MITIRTGKSKEIGGCNACNRYYNANGRKNHTVREIILGGRGDCTTTIKLCLNCMRELKEKCSDE